MRAYGADNGKRDVIGRRAIGAIALLLALGLASCKQPEVTPDQFYRLDAATSVPQVAAGKLAGTVEVDRLAVDGLTGERAIVYVDAANDTTLQAYNYHFWVEPPPILLRDQLVSYLRAAKIAPVIVTADMRVRADYVVGGRIKRLERVTGGRFGVVVEMELWLRRNSDDRLLVLNGYRVDLDGGKDTVADAVTAINRAVATAFGRFVEDIAKS
jgi:ABC-type uncharacterized transport system auxiliary subunit